MQLVEINDTHGEDVNCWQIHVNSKPIGGRVVEGMMGRFSVVIGHTITWCNRDTIEECMKVIMIWVDNQIQCRKEVLTKDTQAILGVEMDDGSVNYVFCQTYGHMNVMGKTLFEWWNRRDILKLTEYARQNNKCVLEIDARGFEDDIDIELTKFQRPETQQQCPGTFINANEFFKHINSQSHRMTGYLMKADENGEQEWHGIYKLKDFDNWTLLEPKMWENQIV